MMHHLPSKNDAEILSRDSRDTVAPLPADTSRVVRIVLVTHFFPAHRGGVELVAGHLAEVLAHRSEMNITWFSSNCDPTPILNGVTCVSVPAWNPFERRLHAPYPIWSPFHLKSLWDAIRDADIVYFHDYIYVGSLTAFSIAKILGKPILITQHVGAVPFRNMLLRSMLAFANRTLGRAMLKQSDTSAFVSATVKRQFLSDAVSARSACLIPNGLDGSTFYPIPDADREKLRVNLNISCDRPCFLFVGRFVEKKGLRILEKLTALLPDVTWIFAGEGQLDPAGWSRSNVRVFRDRTGSTLAELYHVADLLVLPSVGEGFPLVVQESMACGTPAMVGQETASALPEIERVLFSEIVNETNALSAWHNHLMELIHHPEVLARRRQEVAAWARDHWSWDRCADAYREIIQDLVMRPR